VFGGRFSASIGLVGVDFGTRAIKLLQVRQQRGVLRVVGAGRVDLTQANLEGPALVEHLRAAFASGGFTGRRCVVSLPRKEVRVQSVRMPRMDDEELQQAAVWEAVQRFGFERNTMEVNIMRTGAELQGGEHRDEVLLIAAPHEAINRSIEPLVAAGLRPVAMETHFTALARAFGRAPPGETGPWPVRAVVDVGASGSTVLILRGEHIAFCKPIAIGGEHFDRAVADHLQMQVQAARELRAGRMASGALADPSVERAEYDAVRPLLGTFAKEVILCIRYYGVTFRGHPPDHLVLTGGDGLEPRLGETLAGQCKIPVVYDQQDSMLSLLHADITRILHGGAGPGAWWPVAAGLSLRGISPGRLWRPRAAAAGQEAT
jgi:type IV pilus assembly protein PilM